MQAFPPKPFPKIPAKLLRNFSARGPLYAVAATIHDVRRARDLKKFDLLAPEFRKQVCFRQNKGSCSPKEVVCLVCAMHCGKAYFSCIFDGD